MNGNILKLFRVQCGKPLNDNGDYVYGEDLIAVRILFSFTTDIDIRRVEIFCFNELLDSKLAAESCWRLFKANQNIIG